MSEVSVPQAAERRQLTVAQRNAVAELLRDEVELTDPDILVRALLHDALEIRPTAGVYITEQLGQTTTDALIALTPDHRLAGRRRGPGDDEAYHRKVTALPDDLLAVKLADRVHNLRELPTSTNAGRGGRFLASLAGFYRPLVTDRGRTNPTIATLAALLSAG